MEVITMPDNDFTTVLDKRPGISIRGAEIGGAVLLGG